jgi:hypothetical protein
MRRLPIYATTLTRGCDDDTAARQEPLRSGLGQGFAGIGFTTAGPEPMRRRDFLLGAAGAAALPPGAPALARGIACRVLKFLPQSGVAVIDPLITTDCFT